MTHHLTERLTPMLDAAIDTHGHGENIGWESALMSGPQQEPIFLVFLWFPGAVLGTAINASFQIGDPVGITAEQVDAIIRDGLEALRQARSQQVAQQGPQTPAGAPRGSQTPSGLLIP